MIRIIKEITDRHIGFTGKYKMDDKDFKLFLKYISFGGLKTYQGFKDFKLEYK